MANHLRDNLPAQKAANVCAALSAGLDADPVTQDLAPFWDALTAKGDQLAQAGLSLARALSRARAKVGVMDARWDDDAGAFGREVNTESGGKRDQPPNTRFFSKAPSSAVQTFGIAREVAAGRAWILELGRNSSEALAVKWLPILTGSTDGLDAADKARMDALSASAMHETGERLYVEEINMEIDKLEGELKKRFPRQPKRVAAFLAPTRLRKEGKRAEEAEEGEEDTGAGDA